MIKFSNSKLLNRHLPILFSGLLIVAAILFFFFRQSGVEVSQSDFTAAAKSPEIAKLYEVKSSQSAVLEQQVANDITITLGDESKKSFEPKVTLQRWDEVSMSVKPLLTNAVAQTKSLKAIGDKLQYQENGQKVDFYQHPSSKEHPEGAYEIEFVLDSKPATNKWQMAIETQGLEFLYQPFLKNTNPDGSTWQDNGHGGKQKRPANVNGSYAVYYENNVRGDYSAVGGKNYKSGKAFHIYRPQAEDSAGNKVWCELNISGGTLSVTCPQSFLDSAVYPVLVDPTFGYTGVGATEDDAYHNFIFMKADSLPGTNGSLSSISIYGYTTGSGYHAPALYSDNAGAPNVLLAAVNDSGAANGSPGWLTTNISYPSITAGTQYWLGTGQGSAFPTRDLVWLFDSGGVLYWKDNDYTEDDWPASVSAGVMTGTVDEKVSVYATYTTSGGATSPPVQIKGGIKVKGGVNIK